MERKRSKTAPWFLAAALAISVLSAAIVGGWHWLFYRSFCVYEDCRGQGIDVETMKQWEERAEALGIVRMAGWRAGEEETVTSLSTGRWRRAKVTWVYGTMELADKEQLLWGRFGIAQEENCCVISEGLARNLFGSVDVVGEQVKMGDRVLMVSGITKKDKEAVILPPAKGMVEYLSVEFDRQMGAQGKIKRLLEEY